MMKYGLLTYNYISRDSYCPKYGVNMGDYIQSIAARQFLPSVDVFIDRDSVSSYSGDPVKLIMNGWWHIYKGNETTSDAITPLYVAYHINNQKALTKKALEHLKKHTPIGCRDLATMNCLLNHGIDAYLSSCLTLTLGKTYQVSEKERTNTVYFVDCDFLETGNSKPKPNWIKWCLSRTARRSCAITKGLEKVKRRTWEILEGFLHDALVEKRSHEYYPLSLDDNARFQIADQLLRDYSKGKLVVTSRLHCALPVLSMGVPVLFVSANLDDHRYAGALDCVSQIGLDRKQNFVERLDSHHGLIPGTHVLPPSVKAYSEQLSRRCLSFVSSAANETSH